MLTSVLKIWDMLTIWNVSFDGVDGLQKVKEKLFIHESDGAKKGGA
jgi:hypothetical protein